MYKSRTIRSILDKYKRNIFALIPLTLVFSTCVYAQDNTQNSTTDPVTTCMAAKSDQPQAPVKTKKGPIRVVAKALASEMNYDSKAMLKDSILVFSAQDVDPYDKRKPSAGKPYTALECRMIDGSSASLIKYPDGSGKIVGGFADGTIIAPTGNDTYIVAYPNGVRGKLVRQAGGIYKVYRPDDSVTTFKKTMSGDYEITNDKIGLMGTARTDRLGMQYEFNTTTF